MSEYIMRETDCGLATKQEIVGELVRCKDCRFYRFYDGTFGKGWMCFENNTARHGDDYCSRGEREDGVRLARNMVEDEPTVDAEPEPIEFEWCHDCKEYDQEAHCCHRWTKVIRNTVNDMKTQGYEPVRYGKWIWDDDSYYCSECFFHAYGNGLECLSGTYRYCPSCGAKMEVEE